MKKNVPKPNTSKLNTPKTSWGNVAGWYDDLLEKSPDSYQEKVILPNLLRIVDPKPGQKILDLACGQGYFSRILAKNGAQVTGCDISAELIDLAKKNSPKEITYFVASADKISENSAIENSAANITGDNSTSGGFDTAIIILAIQNIEDMRATFIESAKLLDKDGRLIIVINHPAFRIPQSSSWEWDAKDHKQFRRVDSYMTDQKIKIDMAPGSKSKNSTISFHRPLQSYLEEWISHKQSQIGPRAQEEDRTRKEIPLFMCIEARKF